MKKPHEPLNDDLPKLAARLRAIEQSHRVDVPPEVDARILAIARQPAARPASSPFLRIATWSAVAAVLLMGVTVGLVMQRQQATSPTATHLAQSDGEVTILDAFKLARDVETGRATHNRNDIDALAHQAVALAPPDDIDDQNNNDAMRARTDVRFTTVTVMIDPAGRPLAAYQLRITAKTGAMKVVGVEAGDTPPFSVKPPYFDRAAEKRDTETLNIAMFTTAAAADLPRNALRVATLHLVSEGAAPTFDASLILAADHDGEKIPAVLTIREGK